MRGKSYVEEAEQVEGARVRGRASRVDTVAGTRRGEVEARGWCVGFQKSMSCGAVVAQPGWWVAGRGRSRRRVTRRWTNREASGAEGGRRPMRIVVPWRVAGRRERVGCAAVVIEGTVT